MTQNEFIGKYAEAIGVTKKEASNYLDVLGDLLFDCMMEDTVSFTGIGKFSTKIKPATTYRNPQTSESVTKPEKIVPVFKFSKKFKTLVEERR